MSSLTATTPAAEIFKAYDIRGIVDKTLTEQTIRAIGAAIGSEAIERGVTTIVVGRDGRLSGPGLAGALCKGITSTGVHVTDIGAVPTPVTYFSAVNLGTAACISLTGSHNPADYNGLKMVLAGQTLYGPMIQDLRRRIIENDLMVATTAGKQTFYPNAIPDYLDRICQDIKLARSFTIAVDCGNGIAGKVAPELYSRLGCKVIPLFCDVDGHFPNHHPDPSKPENLTDLIQAVKQQHADIGLAFDGDGDRLGVVTQEGEIIYPDRLLMLFADDVLSRQPGARIIYDVKCTRNLAPWIKSRGGEPEIWNTGHALIKTRLKETGAQLAGEMSGHFFFQERWYGFDDGLYAGARLLEVLSRGSAEPSASLRMLPAALSTPEINIPLQENEPHQLVALLQQHRHLFGEYQNLLDIDGLRVEYKNGFGLVRASNTTPVLVLRFEADSRSALHTIQTVFHDALNSVRQGLGGAFTEALSKIR